MYVYISIAIGCDQPHPYNKTLASIVSHFAILWMSFWHLWTAFW